mmetsp:Transcript_76598/g.151545  ORF Transcript_76598/g.151545 Transcript_76598/m.151545 type:complete len:285 (+) Transcript_76598:67-921(+)
MGCGTSCKAGSSLLKAGYGFFADSDPANALKEAIAVVCVEKPPFAFVSTTAACGVDKVMDYFKAVLFGCQQHSVTSCDKILQVCIAEPGVACFLVDAKVALRSVHDSDAATAASALKMKVPFPKGFIIRSTPGLEEAGIKAFGKPFPGVPVGDTAVDDEFTGKAIRLCRVRRDYTGFPDARAIHPDRSEGNSDQSRGPQGVRVGRQAGVGLGGGVVGSCLEGAGWERRPHIACNSGQTHLHEKGRRAHPLTFCCTRSERRWLLWFFLAHVLRRRACGDECRGRT